MDISVAVIYGSRACEHDVSIISGMQAAAAAEQAGYQVTRVYIDKAGAWYVGDALKDMAFYSAFDAAKVDHVLPIGEGGKLVLIRYPETGKRRLFGGGREDLAVLDVAIPVLHGMNGEDGTLQGMLDLMDVPYTSSGVLGSSVGMDKIVMKMVFESCGMPVLPSIWIDRDAWSADRDACIARAEAALPYPVYVKPANLGSSIGISRADDRLGLERALDIAAEYDRRILIEKGVTKLREVNCAVLGYGDDVRASMLEMPMSWEAFLTFDEKYLRSGKGKSKGMTSLSRQIPAPIGDALTKRICDLSIEAFRALDCKGVVRIDYLLDDADDKLYIGEINTIPGSLAFYLWEPLGISFDKLIDKMVECALRANADKRRSVFSYQSDILKKTSVGAKRGGAK